MKTPGRSLALRGATVDNAAMTAHSTDRPRRILLGVTGGIAAYKAADLVRRLRDGGAEVQVVLTAGAARFVTPLTFQALSGRPVRVGLWDEAAEAAMGHIELARWADLVLIAPASADFLARLAAGLADDLLTTTCLATTAPLAVAPAMNQQMWAAAATQANICTLRSRSVRIWGPGIGSQACGETGAGRLLEPADIAARALAPTLSAGALTGRHVVITAGPTREPIDPVRFLSNRSSGKMGFAVAAAAQEAGARVTLVSGPVALQTPAGVERVNVETAAQMYSAVHAAIVDCDVYIGAAAVADYTPCTCADNKIKKTADTLDLHLEKSADILASVAALERRPFVVGFAAETTNVEAHAMAKLERKKLDLIAANEVGAERAFDREDNALLLLWPGGRRELSLKSKTDLAREFIAFIASRLTAHDGG
jgi:phosphopantothenoylcysteine decarboxylase/phosphopantothenate--cysteine ligase